MKQNASAHKYYHSLGEPPADITQVRTLAALHGCIAEECFVEAEDWVATTDRPIGDRKARWVNAPPPYRTQGQWHYVPQAHELRVIAITWRGSRILRFYATSPLRRYIDAIEGAKERARPRVEAIKKDSPWIQAQWSSMQEAWED